MTDTRARDALAAALRSMEHRIVSLTGPDGVTANIPSEYDRTDEADAILAHPFTPDQRRALAAAFLTEDIVAEAFCRSEVTSSGHADGSMPCAYHDARADVRPSRFLAALRETT